MVENVPFDPEARLRNLGEGVDIATFDFAYEDLMRMGASKPLVGDMLNWPFSAEGVTFTSCWPISTALAAIRMFPLEAASQLRDSHSCSMARARAGRSAPRGCAV